MYKSDDDQPCTCGEYYCPKCNEENFRPITKEEKKAQKLLKYKKFITIGYKSYRYLEILENENVNLISNDTDEDYLELKIREVSYIEGNTIHFTDTNDNDYTAIVED